MQVFAVPWGFCLILTKAIYAALIIVLIKQRTYIIHEIYFYYYSYGKSYTKKYCDCHPFRVHKICLVVLLVHRQLWANNAVVLYVSRVAHSFVSSKNIRVAKNIKNSSVFLATATQKQKLTLTGEKMVVPSIFTNAPNMPTTLKINDGNANTNIISFEIWPFLMCFTNFWNFLIKILHMKCGHAVSIEWNFIRVEF